MPLQALLPQVDPGWYARTGEPLDPRLLAAARRSPLGRRLLARTLLDEGGADALLAPRPSAATPTAILRWPRAKLERLVRDLGVLSYAPLIRAEVRREPVRRLKQALGGSYLLALDPTIWDARIDRDTQRRLEQAWEPLWTGREGPPDNAGLYAVLDRQGRSELRYWAARRDRPLGEWVALLH